MNDTADFINALNYWFTFITTIILTAVGFIGNTMTILFILRPEIRNISLFRYILVTMINDCLILVSMWFFMFPEIFMFNTESCKLTTFWCILVFKFSGWIVVVSLVDRLLSVKFPTKFKFRNQLKYQALILVIILFLLGLLTIVNFTYYDMHGLTNKNKTFCRIATPQIQFYLILFDSVIAIIIPFILMVIMSIIIGDYLIKKRKSLKMTKEFKKEIRLIKLMISMSSSFLLFNLPFYILQLTNYVISINDPSFFGSNYIFNFIKSITFQINYTYSSFGFFVCLLSNNVFRKYFYSKFNFSKRVK